MKTAKRHFVSLEALAAELCLPKSYLRNLAAQKLIPCLNVNGRLRFDSVVVMDALTKLSSSEDKERGEQE